MSNFIFAKPNPGRRRRDLGTKGTCLSNPNNMTTSDEQFTYQERLQQDGRTNRLASPSTKHHIPETADRVIAIVKQKLKERRAEGPVGFLKVFRNIDSDHNGTIDRAELKTFLNYYCLGHNKEVFEQVFNHFDPDHSGDIDMSEFLEHILEQSDADMNKEEHGILHSRQMGGSRERDPEGVVSAVECSTIDSKGNMDAVDVIELIRDKIFTRTPLSSGTTTTAFRMFKRGNATISREHFFSVLALLNVKLSTVELQDAVWKYFDSDGDGTLDFDEFVELLNV